MSGQPIVRLNDDRLMPQLGLGVWQASIEQTRDAVIHALNTGYRSVDTAAIYQNEEGVGQALQESDLPREDLFITTKLWNSDQLQAREALETSLQKLQLSYVDLYLIHWPCPQNGNFVDAWRQLIELQKQGLTRSIGVCNFQQPHLEQLIRETGVTPAINQIELHPLFQQRPLHAWNDLHHIRTESWSPLAQGGKGVFDQPLILRLAQKYGKSPAQIVIRWHIDSGLVVIPKSVTPKRIDENFDVFDFSLDKSELSELAALDEGKRLGPEPESFNKA
ncbi:2,5-didehydrogluconate reductase DkgA [Tatumella terrea]|uniref:2,5-didehydrogluconate reductase DkgA n=1 Tax=Tatumella terrea TaxID=419007 RepID=A0ABW1W0M8_9GAMM|nr:2,5-didehydrogluconate reductase DkgA [Tatumella sp. JGM118]MBS0910276.1 2,5-didehydrogluconate reductase DkgA [Tatumella sp. JGM118]